MLPPTELRGCQAPMDLQVDTAAAPVVGKAPRGDTREDPRVAFPAGTKAVFRVDTASQGDTKAASAF